MMKKLFTSLLLFVSAYSAFCQASDDFFELNFNRLEFGEPSFFGQSEFVLIDIDIPSSFFREGFFLYSDEGTGFLINGKVGTYVGKKTYAIALLGFTQLNGQSNSPNNNFHLSLSNFSILDLGVGLRHIVFQKKKINFSCELSGQFSSLLQNRELRIFNINFQPKLGYAMTKDWELNFHCFVRRTFWDFQRKDQGIGIGILKNL